jgi:molybdopterin-guanine dinucleotide biosynthesis protein A
MTISAVLLAGGESRRMGQDKATLRFRSEPLWKHQLELLRRLEPKEIFVSARTDPPWRPADVEFVCDEQPSRGPLDGITSALSRSSADHLLVLAIDVPSITADYLKDLCAMVEDGRGVVPMIGNRAEPLVAIYPREIEIDFRSALTGKDFSLQPLVRRLVEVGKLRPIAIGPDQANLFRNLNEPNDVDLA